MATKIPFRCAFQHYDVIPSEAGSPIRDEFIETVDENGVRVVTKSGESNFQDYIDASLPECLIYNILNRVSNGEVDLLDRCPGAFVDLSGLPTNIHDAYKQVIKAHEFFQGLDPKIKQEFNNSSDEFLSSIGTDRFNSVFMPKQPEPVPDPTINVEE